MPLENQANNARQHRLKNGCVIADYDNPAHAKYLVELLNEYALCEMGGGAALDDQVKRKLVGKLGETPTAISLLYFENGEAVGLFNAFESFSTFAAAPLINLHDAFIKESHRGKGILKTMFDELERIACARGCCKITLEVLDGNKIAQRAYQKLGYGSYELKESAGQAMFWQKRL